MNRKLSVLLILFMVVALGLSACVVATPPPAATEAPAEEPAEEPAEAAVLHLLDLSSHLGSALTYLGEGSVEVVEAPHGDRPAIRGHGT